MTGRCPSTIAVTLMPSTPGAPAETSPFSSTPPSKMPVLRWKRIVAPGTTRPDESTAFAESWSGWPTVSSGEAGVTTTRATLDVCATSRAGAKASKADRRTNMTGTLALE